jgi:membrane associated rhomboid family serine protease
MIKRENSLTTLLIVVISGFFLIQQYFYPQLITRFAIVGSGYVEHSQYYRLLTVALAHASWTHLLFNMLALYQLGNIVEAVFGEVRYIFVLLGSLLAGSFTSLMFLPSSGFAVGASGMIFGLFGALLVVGKQIGLNYNAVYGTLLINAAIPFIDHNVDWHAHLGGLIGGAITAFILKSFNGPQKRLRNI